MSAYTVVGSALALIVLAFAVQAMRVHLYGRAAARRGREAWEREREAFFAGDVFGPYRKPEPQPDPVPQPEPEGHVCTRCAVRPSGISAASACGEEREQVHAAVLQALSEERDAGSGERGR